MLALFAFAQWQLERFVVAQTGADLMRIGRGESRIAFEFDSLRDLISEGAVGADDVHIDAGVLRARLPDGRANFRLNLRGTWLDAGRFTRLSTRISASAAADLVLIFDEPGQLLENTASVHLHAGWNELDIALEQMPWKRARAAADAPPGPWGGVGQRAGEFRLYLIGPAGFEVGLDHLHFLEAVPAMGDPLSQVEWISAASARTRLRLPQPLHANARARIGVLLPLWTQTPESVLSLRDEVRARDAEALFWPALRALPDRGTALASEPLQDWSPPGWALLALALAMLAARLRPPAAPRLRAALDLTLGLGPLALLMGGLGLGETPSTHALGVVLLALVYMLSRLQLRDVRLLGSIPAWRRALVPTLALASSIVVGGLLLAEPAFPGLQRVLLYVPFVALQQLLLQGFLWPSARVFSERHGAKLAALLFAVAHAPNFALMVGAGAAAWLWCSWFARERALLPLIASHYLLGLAAVSFLPPWVLYSAESSLRYFVLR